MVNTPDPVAALAPVEERVGSQAAIPLAGLAAPVFTENMGRGWPIRKGAEGGPVGVRTRNADPALIQSAVPGTVVALDGCRGVCHFAVLSQAYIMLIETRGACNAALG